MEKGYTIAVGFVKKVHNRGFTLSFSLKQKTHQNDGTSFKRKSGKTPNSTNIIAIVTAATPQQ